MVSAVLANPDAHPLFHSDRGFQYTGKVFQFMLSQQAIVFSINSDAIQHTIRRYYGDDFDATRYLDRFFDITMELPPYDENLFLNSIGVFDTSFFFDHFR